MEQAMNPTESSVSGYPPKPQKPASVILWITAVFLLFYGLFFFSAFLDDLVKGNYAGGKALQSGKETMKADTALAGNGAEDTSFGVILGLFLACGMLPLGLSGFSFYIIHRRIKVYHLQTDAWFENVILVFFSLQNGKLTIKEVAEEFRIGASESKKHLDQLVVKNVAEMLVSESGEIAYVLHGFGDDQSGAERIL